MAKITKMDLVDIISASPKKLPSRVKTSGIARGIVTITSDSRDNSYQGLLQVSNQPLFLKFEGCCKFTQFNDVISMLNTSETSGVPVTVDAKVRQEDHQKYLAVYRIKIGNITIRTKAERDDAPDEYYG